MVPAMRHELLPHEHRHIPVATWALIPLVNSEPYHGNIAGNLLLSANCSAREAYDNDLLALMQKK